MNNEETKKPGDRRGVTGLEARRDSINYRYPCGYGVVRCLRIPKSNRAVFQGAFILGGDKWACRTVNGMDGKRHAWFRVHPTKENFRLNLFVLWGCLGSPISECFHGQPRGFDSTLCSTLPVMCSLLGVRLKSDEIGAVEKHLSKMLNEGKVQAEIFDSLRTAATHNEAHAG